MMILSLAVRYLFFFLSFVVVIAIKVDLKQQCGLNSLSCTISDFNDDLLVIDSNGTKYPYTEVVFRKCYLPTIPTEIFSFTPQLERLLIYKCFLKAIPQKNFDTVNNLKSLYLPSNRLTELSEKIFTKLSKIEEIRLSNNHISYIHPKAFVNLTQLRILELNYNKLHELTSTVFSCLSNLEYIDLSFNEIEAIDSSVFEANTRLKTILLSNNNFVVFESNSLAHLPHLNVLDISYNIIVAIRLQSVDTLRAQNSQLRSCVIDGSVIKVRASNNQLESISIADKNSVKEIDVHSNQFTTLSDFNDMLNLQKLDISKNIILGLNTTNTSQMLNLPSLQYLNIANGQLCTLKVENFLLLNKLSHLDLAHNNLQQLNAGVFESLTNLEKIYFEGNRLHFFEYETFIRNHGNVKEMGIFGNNWSQAYLKKMTEEFKANDIKLISRFKSDDVSEMLSLQSTNHPHHTVHAKILDHRTEPTIAPAVNKRDILLIVTMCLVLVILILQLFRILKEENFFTLFNKRVQRTVRPTRLDEEESEPL